MIQYNLHKSYNHIFFPCVFLVACLSDQDRWIPSKFLSSPSTIESLRSNKGRDEVSLNLQKHRIKILSLNLFLMEKCSLIEKHVPGNSLWPCWDGKVFKWPFQSWSDLQWGNKKVTVESPGCFFSPAAAWDSSAIEIWEGFSGSSHLNEWRPLSESNLIVAFLSGCSQHHESCLAVVEKTNFPSTKIFFFPEKRLCSNSTSQGGGLVGAKKKGKKQPFSFLSLKYIYIHQLMCQKTRKIHQLTHWFIDSFAIPRFPPLWPSIQLLLRRRSKRGVILRTSCAVRCGPLGTVATAYLRIRRHLSPFQGDFPQIPWNFSPSYYRNSMVLPPWWVFPTQNHWRLSGTTSPSLVDSYFMKKT